MGRIGISRRAVIAIVAILLCGAVLAAVGLSRVLNGGFKPDRANDFTDPLTTVLDQPVPVSAFSLVDHNNRKFTPENFKRKWTLLFFGYTHCPDVCPTTMSTLGAVHEGLKKGGDLNNTEVVFVSVDPERDTVKQLAGYVPYFNSDFTGLTGSKKEIEALAHQLGIAYAISDPPGGSRKDGYLIDHSASILLIDPLGRQLARFLPSQTPGTILSDLRKIRHKFQAECCIATKPTFDFDRLN